MFPCVRFLVTFSVDCMCFQSLIEIIEFMNEATAVVGPPISCVLSFNSFFFFGGG